MISLNIFNIYKLNWENAISMFPTVNFMMMVCVIHFVIFNPTTFIVNLFVSQFLIMVKMLLIYVLSV